MKKPPRKQVPQTLSDEAGRWWAKLIDQFEIRDEAGYLLLQTALEAFTLMRQAQALLDTEGICIRDKWNQPKPHPASTVVRDARAQMLAALKALNLDVEPLRELGRPSGGY